MSDEFIKHQEMFGDLYEDEQRAQEEEDTKSFYVYGVGRIYYDDEEDDEEE